MQRFFLSGTDLFELEKISGKNANIGNGHEIRLSNSRLLHQLGRVLRMSPRDQLLLLDGSGKEYLAEIVAIEKKHIIARILASKKNEAERAVNIYLYQSLPKQMSRFEFVLQKGTELGVKGFVPMHTARGERRTIGNKLRLETIIREAAEQSGRGILPQLSETADFSALAKNPPPGQNLLPYEFEKEVFLKDILKNHARNNERINIFIGPEGGFEAIEVDAAKKAGFLTFTLGNLILRTETAGIAVVSRLVL